MTEQHAINWFEIPVSDFDRAHNFYQKILDIEMPITNQHGYKTAYFPSASNDSITGAICYGEGYMPSGAGSIIYLNANPDLLIALNRVQEFGGRVLVPKSPIGEGMGYYAFILDTEGNRIALYSKY
jgi:uncharacterized protein